MQIIFTAQLSKFAAQGEKTGWTYLKVPATVAGRLNPGIKKSYRVKGKIDDFPIEYVALIPMGGGDFILAVNSSTRKAIQKQYPASVQLTLELDVSKMKLSEELLQCLTDEPAAEKHFKSLPPSHQHYYSKWVQSAKTDETRAKRIALAVNTLAKKMNYGEMIRSQKEV